MTLRKATETNPKFSRNRWWELSHLRIPPNVTPFVYVNEKFRFLYIPIGKTASTSIISALSKGELPHGDAKKSGKSVTGLTKVNRTPNLLSEPPYNEYFKFTFVRNPFDKLVSLYLDRVCRREKDDFRSKYDLERGASLCEYINKILTSDNIDFHYELQYAHIIENHAVVTNFVGRFESLEHDYYQVLSKIGLDSELYKLPCTNKSRTKKSDLPCFDKTTRLISSNFYKQDLNHFGYELE